MLRRSLQTRVRVGAAARRRIQSGGPRATGRPAATVEEWVAIRRVILRRARWRCQACGRWGGLEVHHVIKRAQGGSDGLRGIPGGNDDADLGHVELGSPAPEEPRRRRPARLSTFPGVLPSSS